MIQKLVSWNNILVIHLLSALMCLISVKHMDMFHNSKFSSVQLSFIYIASEFLYNYIYYHNTFD